MRAKHLSAFALAVLLAGPAFAVKQGPPIAPGDNQLLPAVQKEGMAGMDGNSLPAVQLPDPGPPGFGGSNLPPVQHPSGPSGLPPGPPVMPGAIGGMGGMSGFGGNMMRH